MRLLPALDTPAGPVRLPLSDAAAGRLIAMLLSDGAAGRREQAAEALRRDASLAVWALCRAAPPEHDDLRSVDALAEWLAENALAQLQTDDPENGPAQTFDDDRTSEWADLAARPWGVAELAAQLAAACRIDPERAYFAGLVHAADAWLAHGPQAPPAEAAAPPTSTAECVAWARRLVNEGDAPLPELPGFAFEAAAHQARVASAREAWSAVTGAGEQLFRLVARLARLERLERDFQGLLEREKLDALKELAYGAGHEINNPLANISARAQTLLEDERDPERRRKLAAINTQAFRAHEMIADMMLFARPPRPKLAAVEVSKLLARLVEELAPMAAEQRTELLFHATAGAARLVVAADTTQLAVAVRALCVNALEVLVTGGRVEVTLARGAADGATANSRAPGETVQIAVSDDGPGITADVRRHLFDPFYSGREAGRGLGFGLSKCWRIVSMHGGQVEVDSTPGRGSVFTISLPVGEGE